ncbi:MAG: 16S rRNA (cytosine(967)-C(5))-methyltransferase RsmB [Clostridiales bacterium]|nr:16S rRNA (cytosine(967)-C(5))-methyltransferase RsmB [Clostridiales bacterium]
MTPRSDASRNTAYRCLLEVLENQGYSNLVLKRELLGSDLPEQGRSFVTAMVYGTITRVYTIDSILSTFLKKNLHDLDPSVRTCLRMGAWQILFSYGVKDYAAVSSTVDLAREVCPKGSESLINAVLRKIASSGKDLLLKIPEKKLDLRYSVKSEISGCFIKWYGREKAEKILSSFLSVPPVTLRRNALAVGSQEELMEKLSSEGVPTRKNEILPDLCLELTENITDIASLSSYQDGDFSVQSTSAMLVGVIADPKKGDSVLDTCSAPGGKTAHMAEIMKDQGHIDALDANEVRLRMVDETAKRLHITNISTLAYDGTFLSEEKEKLLKEYDLVLCDVPCSGLGLLHRKPDIRVSMTYEKMQTLLPVQESILQNASLRVKKGGFLIYSTCTVNPNENELQVEKFLKTHPEFSEVPFTDLLPEKLKKNPRLLEESRKGRMTILPDEEGMDGFFIAKLERRNG